MSIYLLSPSFHKGTIHYPMIQFRVVDTSLDLSKVEILMFTSKQGVKSAQSLNPLWKNLPCIAIGNATAKQIVALGGTVMHQPKNFYAQSLSQDIVENFKAKKILYLRPKKVSFDSKSFLETSGVEIEEKVIYETFCIAYKQESKPPRGAIIICTSPSSIYCFLENFGWDSSYIAVVIGKATQRHLPPRAQYLLADTQSIEACVRKAQTI
ncbi:MAG: uroporphyrinogen-III synthase [Sulfurovum sp.]|nr:uroporphyrinogen-III synthase [Sulfurovum sp.]